MKLLFDQGTPAPLRNYLPAHCADTLAERGWSEKSNGELLDLAEQEGYGILVTTDRSMQYQQNMSGRQIGIIELVSDSTPYSEYQAGSLGCAAWQDC